jgi:uncharacterized protein (TIGR03437 family)
MRHSKNAGNLFSLGVLLLAALHAATAPNFTMILGQPSDRSVTVNTRAETALEIYFEYGLNSGAYTAQTKSAWNMADPYASGYFVLQSVMTGLQADTQYYYRMDYRTAGSTGAFTPGTEYSFHTQRLPGSSFVFCMQGDSHPERANSMFNSNLYIQTLTAVAKEHPDFYITSGDDFSVDTLPTPYAQSAVTGRYTLQLPYFDLLARSSPLFLGTGNHEETSLSNYNLPADGLNSNQVPIWAQNARNLYYSVPGPNDGITGTFYTGNTTTLPGIGLLRDYYAWQWGDALFVVIDPYWNSPAQVDTGLGGQNSATAKTPNKWDVTHGDAQYQWLKQTLERSTAKWKFIFAHHVMGTGRGGIEIANQYEWGGNNTDGTWGFTTNRPTWPEPLHQLLVANHVTIFFQGHDHLFAHQVLDGVTYQSVANPADNTYTAFNADAYNLDDTYCFTTNRPNLPMPIHQLFIANHVTAYFHGHDHLYAHQSLDGITYQEVPQPSNTNSSLGSRATDYGYVQGTEVGGRGYLRVQVASTGITVQYIETWLPSEQNATQKNGMVADSYTMLPYSTAAVPAVTGAAGTAEAVANIAPNSWVEIDGVNLAPVGDERSWNSSDFVNNQMPTQMDGVSVSVNEKAAYVSYISPTQINILTGPEAITGPVTIRVTVNGIVSAAFTAQGQTAAPAFFTFGGTSYVAATHADGSYLGPTTLYPGTTTPSKPGETIMLYGNAFGKTASSITAGLPTQSGSLPTLPLVQVGGVAATVQYAGLVSPGLFQFNVVVPANTPDGDQPISAIYSGSSTRTGTLLSVHH